MLTPRLSSLLGRARHAGRRGPRAAVGGRLERRDDRRAPTPPRAQRQPAGLRGRRPCGSGLALARARGASLGAAVALARSARPKPVAHALIVSRRRPHDLRRRDGGVRSIQEADLILPTEALDPIWSPEHLERLARTYWRWLTTRDARDRPGRLPAARPAGEGARAHPAADLPGARVRDGRRPRHRALAHRARRPRRPARARRRGLPGDRRRSGARRRTTTGSRDLPRRGRGRELLPGDRVVAQPLGLREHAVAHPRARHPRLPARPRAARPRRVAGRRASRSMRPSRAATRDRGAASRHASRRRCERADERAQLRAVVRGAARGAPCPSASA